MGSFLKTQNAFSNGEVAPDFYAMNNVSGVSKLENVDVLQSGGLKRRPGLKKIKNILPDLPNVKNIYTFKKRDENTSSFGELLQLGEENPQPEKLKEIKI